MGWIPAAAGVNGTWLVKVGNRGAVDCLAQVNGSEFCMYIIYIIYLIVCISCRGFSHDCVLSP